MFFVSIPIGTNDVQEWRLVQLMFELSVELLPSCMQTGKFLVDFYISHPADWRYNAVNQRFWLQYFEELDVLHPDQASKTIWSDLRLHLLAMLSVIIWFLLRSISTYVGTLKDGYVRRVPLPRVLPRRQSAPTSDL